MPMTPEARRAYRQRPEVKARTAQRQREKYATDPAHRQKRIADATAHRQTPLGTVMSRLRINNHYARKKGYAECTANALEVLEAFTGDCAICRATENLVIDHDHTTGKFRGWLCGACNSALGYFDDDPARMERAAIYLEEEEERHGQRLEGQ